MKLELDVHQPRCWKFGYKKSDYLKINKQTKNVTNIISNHKINAAQHHLKTNFKIYKQIKKKTTRKFKI